MNIEITQPFEINYDPKSQVLSLMHVESPSGRQVMIRFSPQQTRALYDCLAKAGEALGGPLGSASIERQNLQ